MMDDISDLEWRMDELYRKFYNDPDRKENMTLTEMVTILQKYFDKYRTGSKVDDLTHRDTMYVKPLYDKVCENARKATKRAG